MKRRAPAYKRPGALAEARKLNDGIRHELRRYPADKVAAFVRSVGAALGSTEIAAQYADETARRESVERLLRATQDYQRELGRFVLAREFPANLAVKPAARQDNAAQFYRARAEALRATSEVRLEAERALRLAKRPTRGRRKADPHGLLTRIARRYVQLFGVRPTSTPGGAFSNIAALVLENLHGTAPRDVSRQVRTALKAL